MLTVLRALRSLDVRAAVGAARRSGALVLTAVLLLPLGPLLVANLAHRSGAAAVSDLRWNVDRDRSYIEVYGYVLLLVAAALLLGTARRWSGAPVLGAWAALLLVAALDDGLALHEAAGRALAVGLPELPVPGLRTQDLAELVVLAGTGALLLAALWTAHVRSSPRARAASWGLLGLLGLWAVPGVLVDLVHETVTASLPGANEPLIALEAGGELAGTALLLGFAFHLRSRVRQPD